MSTDLLNIIPSFADAEDSSLQDAADKFLNAKFPNRSISRVLLVTPPDSDSAMFRFDTAKRKRYTNYPPYGLGVLATHLRSMGVEVSITNLNFEILEKAVLCEDKASFDFDAIWQKKLADDVETFKPDLVGVTCMFTMTHSSLKAVSQFLAERGQVIAIGGVHVSNDVERILDDIPEASFAFLKEGDKSLQTFVQCVNRQAGVEDLGQVIFNTEGTRLSFAAEAKPETELLNVFPAYDLMKTDECSQYGVVGAFYFLKEPGARIATALSNRGCRAQCTFCSVRNFNGAGVRQRSYMNVVDELQMLEEHYGIEHLMWLDDDLLKDDARTIAMFNEMVRRNLHMTWDATNGVIAASCSEEVVAAAAASGCIAVNIGMETGNPTILRQVRKPGTVEKFLKAAEVLRKYEQIHSSVFLMVGFPGETLRMILDTINVARTMDLDWCRISQLQPLPNTPIYNAMVEQGLIQDVGSKELRFMGGAYGKQTEMESGFRLATENFAEAFGSISLDSVPVGDQITDIWFYMNYHLNFHRLFSEHRPNKIREQIKNLRNLSDRISPENGFASYFLGYLDYQLTGQTSEANLRRLEEILSHSPYWVDRFAAFGLSPEDLKTNNFANKDKPRLVPTGLPASELAC